MKYYGLSDIGMIRENNQDSFFCAKNENDELFAIVCDGIGGGKAGDVASKIATEVLKDEFLKREFILDDCKNKEWICNIVRKANEAIYLDSLTSKKKHGMGTTLVGVLITPVKTYVFHLGDSRLYGVYEDELICLTEDHNLAADLIRSGEMSEEEALAHPRAKALTNALGIWSQYRVEINIVKHGYESLLICSDGLYGYVSEQTILDVIKSENNIENKVEQLINISNLNGGFDNITIILIENGGYGDE